MSQYTTKLQAGLGMLVETRNLLDLWSENMSTEQLNQAALESGEFPDITARRLRNVVKECFAPRYLVCDALPARILKPVIQHLPDSALKQICLVYTARANEIVRDFISEVYWPMYASGRATVGKSHARLFVEESVRDGRTTTPWSESTITRVSTYLGGVCEDFGLLGESRSGERAIEHEHLHPIAALLIAYDLNFQGSPDMLVLESPDWSLFGLDQQATKDVFKRLMHDRHLFLQSAGSASSITWIYKTIGELADAIK